MSSKSSADSVDPESSGSEQDTAADGSNEPVTVSGWTEHKPKIHRRTFPGETGGSDQPLRLVFDRAAYAELLSHAKEHLDVEVCGVLMGEHCEDDDGPFVAVTGIIRGEAARQAGTHVTFTHETWDRIHERREQELPKLEIVGWYHSHPGFGVEWSDMDLFIQRNFFTGFHQVAVVVDPIGGEEAACVSLGGGIEHLSAFWVDSRERRCTVPRRHRDEAAGGLPDQAATNELLHESLQRLETRVAQLVHEVDEQRRSMGRFLLTAGLVLGLLLIGVTAYAILTIYRSANLPPEEVRFASVPVQVGDDTYLMGVQVVRWRLPDSLARRYRERVQEDVVRELRQQLELLLQQEQLDPHQLEQAWSGSRGTFPLAVPVPTITTDDLGSPPVPQATPANEPEGEQP